MNETKGGRIQGILSKAKTTIVLIKYKGLFGVGTGGTFQVKSA